MNNSVALDWAALLALVLASIHLAAPRFRPVLAKRAETLGILGSGMAIGYVFVHLLHEIDAAHIVMGRPLHLVMLVGFLVYYWVESRAVAHAQGDRESQPARTSLDLRLAFGWLYGWLLLYTLPESFKGNGLLLLPPLIGICLHLFYEDFHQAGPNAQRFDAKDRFILASGPIAGWLTDLLFFEDDLVVSGILTAFLSGSVFYKVFSRDVPRGRQISMYWFAGGVLLFVLLDSIGRG